ncbi:hypothetical protein [Brachyspira sp.]|uniref:hypothetical protein n=1 Tax=Brachyspira sp. TaxID=1977261 RepID=UPI002630E302|nr:hypothetical protein [Brachyspira sp.]
MKNKLLIFIIASLTLISINNSISFIFFFFMLAFLIIIVSCSTLSNIYNYQHFYLINKNKEYLNILILNDEHEYGSIYYSDKNNNKIEYKIKKLNKLDGYFKAESPDGKKLNGFLPNRNSGFEGRLNNENIYFEYPSSYMSETNIIQYTYSNSIGKAKINYKIYLFLLNNPNNVSSINKINASINKEYGITETTDYKDQKDLYKTIEKSLNKKIQNNFHKLETLISNEQKVYNITVSIPNINLLNNGLISISSNKILNNATYSLNTGEIIKITDIIADTNKCLSLIKYKMKNHYNNDYYDNIDENKNDNMANLKLENSYFYLTPKGIIFNWLLEYRDDIIDEYIKYSSIFIEAKELEDVISNKYKNIFD